MSIYVRLTPHDRRLHMVCDTCRIDRIALTIDEAKRDAHHHKATHHVRPRS